MKVVYLIIAFFVFFGFSLIAQPAYTPQVTEIEETISVGEKSGFAVNIIQAKKKNVANAWQKMLKKQNDSKEKVEDKKGEIFITGAMIERLHHDPINIFALITELDEGTRVEAFFELDSVFINSSNNPDASLVATNILEEFALESYKDAVRQELKDEEKKLSNLENDLKKLEKENERMDDETKEKVFTPFFTTKEKGSGIGLSLSRQIVHLHKGTIDIYSEVNNGTAITIELPLQQ